MQIFCNNFIYDGISPSDYGMTPGHFNSSGLEDGDIGMKLDLTAVSVGAGPVPLLLDSRYADVLEMEITLISDGSSPDGFISPVTERNIYRWLTGRKQYAKLTFPEGKLDSLYFMAVPINVEPYMLLDKTAGFRITFRCDAPWGWEEFSLSKTVDNALEFQIDNTSDDLWSDLPMVLTITKQGTGEFYLYNKTSGETMLFTELPSGAATTVDGNTLIVSSTVPRHNFYPVFNKKFLRLKPGINELKASGSADLTISCLFPRKAGI